MANESITFDIKVNGKEAKKSIEEVEKAQEDLGDTTERTSKNIKVGWAAIGASVAAVTVSVVALANKSAQLEKAMFGLNKEQKQYIEDASRRYAIDQEILAGYVQTGKAAGMTIEQTKKMIDQAVALGRAYPNESTETFVDNIREFVTTGKEAGYITDVLESHFKTADLSTISFADKVEALEKVTAGVNKEFDKTTGAKIDQAFNNANVAATNLGNAIVNMIEKSPIGSWFKTATNWAYNFSEAVERSTLALNQMNEAQLKAELADVAKEKDALENPSLWGRTKQMLTPQVGLDKQAKNLRIREQIIEDNLQKLAAEKASREQEQAALEEALAKKRATEDEANNKSLTKTIEKDKAIIESYKNVSEEIAETAQEISKAEEDLISGMSNALSDFVTTGKLDFKSLANSMLADMVRIQSQALVSGIFGNTSGGGVLGAIGGLFGFHSGGEVKHSGGLIGNMPSYHSGMRSDERLAKLQVGEAVINRSGAANNQEAIEAMNRGSKIGGGDRITTAEISFNVQAIDAASFDSYLVNNRKTIESIISNSISSNGSVRKVIKQSI